jgi:hypothetical protein
MSVSKKRVKHLRFNSDDFYRKTNTVTLLFLVILILMLINFSKILAVVGENEIERSYVTGNVAGSLNITVTEDPNAETEDANVTTSDAVAAATTDGEVLTSGGKLGFNPGRLELDMIYNGLVERDLVVRNNANYDLELSFGTSLKDYVVVEPSNISIAIGESEIVIVRFTGKDLGVITGYLSASGSGLKSYVPIILNVGSINAKGNLKVNIPEEFKQINAGEDILVSVDLSGFDGDVVEIVYFIKDSENNELIRSSQFMTIRDKSSFDKTLTMPPARDGLYVVGVELRYAGNVLVDSEILIVGRYEPFTEKPATVSDYGLSPVKFKIVLLSIIIMIIILFAVYSKEIGNIKRMEENFK